MSDNRPQSPRTLTQARQELQAARARVAELEAQLSENHRDLAARLTGEGYRRTLDNLLEGCQILGFDWRYLYINDAGARYGRQPKEALLGSTIMERYPGIERTELFAALERCMNERTAQDADFEFVYPDGSMAWFEFRIQPVPEGLFVLTLDTRGRERSEERFRSLFEHMLNGFAYCKIVYEQGRPQDFVYLDVNQAFETLTGLKNVVGKKVSEVIPGIHESDPELFEIYDRVALTGKPESFETYVKALAMWLSISVYSPAREHFVAVFNVITDRKGAENAPAEERTLLRTLIDNLPDRVYAKDTAGRFIIKNEVDARLMGAASTDEVIGKTDFDYYPREVAEQFNADDQVVIQSGQPIIDRQELVKNADGTQGWLLTSKVPLRDAQGKVIGLVGVGHDITLRRQAEQQIEKLNRTLAVLSDVNQAIVRVRQMPALFEVICHIAVERGGLHMAWVGLLDPETRRVKPMAHGGGAEDYLDKLDIVPDDELLGRGPTAIAVRTGSYVVCNDIEHDPRMASSCEDALRLGYRALVAFPLTVAGHVRGAISLYAGETYFFDDQELRLLDELASDISFAMEFAEQEEQRQKAEAGLKRYAQRLELLHEIDTGIIGARSIQELVDSALKRLRQLIPCRRVSVGLIDHVNGDRIIFSVDHEGPSALEKGVHIPTPPDWYGQFSGGSIHTTRDLRLLQEPSPTQSQLIKEGLVSSLQALLMAQGQPIGTLNLLADTPDYFTTEHEEIVAQVANQLAIAIRQLHLSEELARHSTQLELKVAERTAELQAAKEHAEAILNNSLDGILLIRPDLHIEQTNRAFHTLFGCESKDCLNRSLLDFISTDDANRVETLIQAALRDQAGKQIEMYGRRQDGTMFDAELSIGTVKDDGLVCTIRHIGERRRAGQALRESEARYRLLAENITDMVIRFKLPVGQFVYVSPSSRNVLGYEPKELIGRSGLDLIHPDDLNGIQGLFASILRQPSAAFAQVVRSRHKDGRYLWLEYAGRVIYSEQTGEVSELIVSARDVTERTLAEGALKAKVEEEREFQRYLKELHLITIELAQVDQIDEFYRRVVQLGLERLGFERLALFLYDEENAIALGTYGTDSHGNINDESHLRFTMPPTGVMDRALRQAERFCIDEEIDLQTALHPTGRGWNAAAVLWNGTQSLGWLVADNGIHHRPISKPLMDNLALYSLAVGTLLTRKQAEQALRAKADEEREFQRYLRELHLLTIELAQVDQIDEFYKCVVKFGLERLGFERLALFLRDAEHGIYIGTYGTDLQGNLTDERHFRMAHSPTGIAQRALERAERFCMDEDTELHTNGEPTGRGWNAAAVLWNGAQGLGWLVADNGIHHRPISKPLMDTLALYSLAVGTLLTRKQAEQALMAKADEEREFQRYLKELHLITIELAQVDQMDEFYKCVVKFGLERLGFERLALFLRDAEQETFVGTYGTDVEGRLADERGLRYAHLPNCIMQRALQSAERFCLDEDAELHTSGEPTGRGWNAAAVLWSGAQGLGWLVADNGIHHRPASKPLMETLALYSLAVGTLLTRRQAEAALRASEEKFRSLMEAAPEAIVISDRQGSITLLNVEAENMFGYKREELLGQNVSILVPEALREGHERYQAAFVSAPSSRAMGKGRILPARSKDGREFQVDVSLSHIKTPDDVLVMSVVTDITERKRAEEALRQSEARYRSVIEVATDQILLIDTQGTILMVNPSALRDSDYNQNEMLGHGLAEFLTPESQSDFLREFPSLLRFGINRQELGFVRKDSSVAIMDSSASVVYGKDNQAQSIMVVQRDITKRRQVEEALFQALEKEKELNELKSQFVSMASHEFRTPLATILTLTETLNAYRQRMTEPQIDQRLGKIKEQVGHLKDIMEDVLQLARMQARRVEFSPVLLDLDSLCRSVIDEFQSQPNTTHQLLYTCHTALHQVKLDKKLMRQIINNLVSNAIKYSPDGKPVTISLDHTGEALELKVRDEGIGIPEADLRHLYEPFHRASNVGTIPGTGLGLVITRESVALHGGDITVESQVGAGTTFTVSIPIMVEGEQGHDENPGD